MGPVSYRGAVLAALAFAALNLLWLAGGNASWVPDNQRALIKTGSIALALIIFAALIAHTARRLPASWLQPTVLTAALSVALGLVLILALSALWYPGPFFHDGVRLPQLLTLALVVIVGAVVLAGGIGLLARTLSRSTGT
ncbi:MAG TPA: hypothetical protein VNK43_05150 [Gemmatimonadales bacterium]|nr:hypothetical protein [Gemmatimonadales bacterium]